MTFERKRIGATGERLALDHYTRMGFREIESNSRTRHGEIDLILTDGTTLVFCEVKTRLAGRGDPFDSITPAKRRQVRRMASNWLATHRLPSGIRQLRLDAVGVSIESDGSLRSLRCLEGAL